MGWQGWCDEQTAHICDSTCCLTMGRIVSLRTANTRVRVEFATCALGFESERGALEARGDLDLRTQG